MHLTPQPEPASYDTRFVEKWKSTQRDSVLSSWYQYRANMKTRILRVEILGYRLWEVHVRYNDQRRTLPCWVSAQLKPLNVSRCVVIGVWEWKLDAGLSVLKDVVWCGRYTIGLVRVNWYSVQSLNNIKCDCVSLGVWPCTTSTILSAGNWKSNDARV